MQRRFWRLWLGLNAIKKKRENVSEASLWYTVGEWIEAQAEESNEGWLWSTIAGDYAIQHVIHRYVTCPRALHENDANKHNASMPPFFILPTSPSSQPVMALHLRENLVQLAILYT